ncbi:arf-GAP with SH3 domain, ANK repeat and PH domain-containing protein 1-like [Hippocampus comes]|uniref:arf-GAP with SH3 domain, ANK repeat and PH domain-containing protein 1-like n=1 Tax=Hippocampus comes TaxID=109280 RepID=UPI00094F02FB|nr:PREDICTED: arf-GAP with SH3 domain, ANK repeat and PH domain-containing protein 1-like [Hippocampus comes]
MSPVSNKFEGIPQQQSTTSSNTKSTLGPRVLPKLPQKVALRKIETIHHPSLDKAGLPPEVFQKSPPGTDTPQKAAAPERPQKINAGKSKARRVKTIYDCQADNDDELTFVEGEVIVVTGEEDQEWWIGHIEGEPERKGVFPMSFVHILSD